MKYIVYLTINKVNNKLYIGVHKTDDPNVFDGYIGCGANINKPSSYMNGKELLHKAILKYGTSAFYRITIEEFDDLESALNLEKHLVTESFVKNPNTYNVTLGGGMPPLLVKEVYQFNLQGNLIKEWSSIKAITNHYKCNHDRIAMCINGKYSFDNCYWSFEKTIDINKYRLSPKGYVYQYDCNGNLLNIFKNATECSQKLDLDKQSIINAVFGRTKLGNNYFLKANDDVKQLLIDKANKKVINKIKIYKYNPDKTFNCEYESVTQACKENNVNKTSILRAIKSERLCKGFYYSYEKDNVLVKFSKVTPKAVKIALYDLNHNLIKIWDSVTECKKEFPCCLKVCRKQNRQTKGFIFEYIS